MSAKELERLAEPWNWKHIADESPLVTHEKIRRAKELGVVAVLFTAEQVTSRIKELATLEHNLRNGGVDNNVYAAIMKGGVPFATPFFRNIAGMSPNMNPVVDYIQASRYGDSQNGRDQLDVIRKFDPKTDINGLRLTYVEDTIDEGATMELLGAAAQDSEACFELGDGVTGASSEIGIITLTDKKISNLSGYEPNAVLRGMWIPNVWVGGNGLDGENEAMRWAPEHVITSVQDVKYRDIMPEVLDTLGERAVMGMDDITWINSD